MAAPGVPVPAASQALDLGSLLQVVAAAPGDSGTLHAVVQLAVLQKLSEFGKPATSRDRKRRGGGHLSDSDSSSGFAVLIGTSLPHGRGRTRASKKPR